MLSYGNTLGSLGQPQKAVETQQLAHVPTAFLLLPNFRL